MTLGCGEYTAFLQASGGSPVIAQLDYESLSFGRKLDDMSSASVTLGTKGLADEVCCMALANLEPFTHELAIYRNGQDPWIGPVQTPDFGEGKLTIPATDLFQWFERRVVHADYKPRAQDLAAIFLHLVVDALEPDTTPNINCVTSPTGITADRDYHKLDYQRSADALRELSRTGMDFTAIGRKLYAGGIEVTVPELPPILQGMLINAHAVPHGDSKATRVIIRGQNKAGTTVIGLAGEPNDTNMVEQVFDESAILDQNSANAAAVSRYQMLRKAPVYLSGTLDPACDIEFSALIPGARWPANLSVNCKRVKDTYRLQALDVQVTNSDQGRTEAITPTLIPLGEVN